MEPLLERPARTRPMQPHGLPGADLGDPVDVLVDHHADDRIAAGDRMVGPEDHRKTVRRHLDCPAGRALAGQLTVRPAVLQRHADQPHADPVAAVGDLPVGADQHVGVGEPVVARSRHHRQFDDVVLDRGHRRLVEFGEFLGVLADRQHVARLQRQRTDRRHHVVAARAEHGRDVDAAADRQIRAQPGVRRAQRDHLAVVCIMNAVGAERNSVDRGIGVGTGHRDGHVPSADPRAEPAERHLDGGTVTGVGHQPVGQLVRAPVGGTRPRHTEMCHAWPAEVFDQRQRTAAQNLQRRRHARASRN